MSDRSYPRTDLCACTASAWQQVLDYAFDLGRRAEMHGHPEMTGREIADLLATRYRHGHLAFLRSSYMAARFQIRTMTTDRSIP